MTPRIGIAGFFLEANRRAPVTTGAMFEASFDLAGDALLEQLRATPPRTLPDLTGFVAGMDDSGDWTPVALRAVAAYPGGPADRAWFDALLADLEARLRAAMPLDGVFVSSHGAALTTDGDEADAEFHECIRRVVGPGVPVIAVLDLHANVTRRMVDALSALVAYRTNPHVDLRERGEQAAALMRRMLAEGPGVVALEKLPFVPASTDQLIAPGTPYQELVAQGQAHVGGPILDVSLCGGFALADSASCGFAAVVTARNGQGPAAQALARELAGRVWSRRRDFLTPLTPLDEAVRLAVEAGRGDAGPLILADVGDNPGGGGGGNTTTLLRALLDAGAQGVLLAVFTDPPLAAQAHALGVGARFLARFNRGPAEGGTDDPFAQPLSREARVVALCSGRFVGRKGLVKGSLQEMGPGALLDLGTVQVAVISKRQQLLDPAQLEAFGIDLRAVRTLVVKSRGHFRAAFEDFAPPARIFEVDAPGATSPNLATLGLRRLPRPCFPLDADTRWPG
jgi:microcystin degradation protein MlrC